MINVSNSFKEQVHIGKRNYLCYADITLKDGTVLKLESDRIWTGGIGVEDAVSNSSSFDIGAVIINKGTLVLNNIYDDFSKYDFGEAKVILKVGLKLPDGTIEKVEKGTFVVDEPKYNGAIITLECLDDMRKFDKDYSKSKLTFPATVWEMVQDACSVCDVTLGIASIPNGDMVVQNRPNDESLTFRQLLHWIGQITCQWFKINVRGQLVSGWYDVKAYEELRILSGGTLGDGLADTVSAGTFGDGLQDTISGGTFGYRKDYHNIHSLSSTNIDTDDVVITGIKVTEYLEDSQNTPNSYQVGEDGYVLDVSQNKLIAEGMGQEIASYLAAKLVGLRFRPMNVGFQNDPTIEAGDIALVSDYKGNVYKTLITGTNFRVGSTQTITCGAKSAARNSASRYSQATRYYLENRKVIQKERTEREKALENLEKTLENSSGMYVTEEEQDDGSVITYIHDKKTLEESKNVIKITAEAIGVSNDGGKTWPYGFTLTGEMIVKVIQTIGLNASWINTGSLVVKDKDGKEALYVNVDTGEVRINATKLTIKGEDLETTLKEVQNVIISSTEPEDKGKIWFDTSVTPSVFKRWNEEKWVAVNDEDIGARNFLLKSNTLYENNSYPTAKYDLDDCKLQDGEEVTLRIKGQLGDGKTHFYVYNSGGVVGLTQLYPSDQTDGIYTKTFKWKTTQGTTTVNNEFISVFPFPSGGGPNNTIEWAKLVKGRRCSSDWTPALGDIANDIKDAIGDSEIAITNKYTSLIEKTAQQINEIVQNIKETTDGNTTSITRVSNQLQITSEMAQFVKTTTETLTDIVNGKVSVEEIKEWARFDGAKLELGADNSTFKAILTNEELGFYQGTNKVAWISNNSLYVLKAFFEEYISVGALLIVDEHELGYSLM